MSDTPLLLETAEIVAAYLSHNQIEATELPTLIKGVHAALARAQQPVISAPMRAEPAVPVRESVRRDYIVCLEDGTRKVSLKRYLRRVFGLTPQQYRERWGLPRDYPMVAPAYAERRREIARTSGLGKRRAVSDPATATPPARKRLGISFGGSSVDPTANA